MENTDNLKYCKTNACSRFHIVIASPRKRCEMCGMKLRGYHGDEKFLDHDQKLVIIEGSTSPNADHRCIHNNSVYESCAECNRYYCSHCSGTPLNPKTVKGQTCLDGFHPVEAYRSNGTTSLTVYSSTTYQRHEEPADTFHVDCDIHGKCPILVMPEVRIPFSLFTSWFYLTRAFNTEWMAYLIGTAPEADKDFWWLDPAGMYFPDQDCTAGHVTAKRDCEMRPGTIAAVHSHVDFQASFSPEDERHFNFPIELVVNRSGNLDNVVRIKLDCGRYQRAKGKLLFVGGQQEHDLRELLQSKITVAAQGSVPAAYRDAALFHTNGKTIGPAALKVTDKRRFNEDEYWRKQDRYNRDTQTELDDRHD